MANPAPKSPLLEQLLEDTYGRTTAILLDYCVECRKPAEQFRDDASQREYTMSGLCQRCQDRIFGIG